MSLKPSTEPVKIKKQQPIQPQLEEEGSPQHMNQTFETAKTEYQNKSQSFNAMDLEFEKFPQLNQDYMNHEHKLMSSDEKINKNKEDSQEDQQKKKERGMESVGKEEGRVREESQGPVPLMKSIYQTYFADKYFLKKNELGICPGDLVLLYDNLTSVLKRNISYSKFLMRKNEELEERIRIMEQRSRMLSRELQSVSEKWKREGKMDISR
jgi:hypothetical protein